MTPFPEEIISSRGTDYHGVDRVLFRLTHSARVLFGLILLTVIMFGIIANLLGATAVIWLSVLVVQMFTAR
jgi:hypothetical protein